MNARSVSHTLKSLPSFALYSIFALVLALAAFCILGQYGPEGQRRRSYERIQVGATYAELLEEYGEAPNAVIRCRRCRVAVYLGKAPFSERQKEYPESVSTLGALPHIYDAMEFLVSQDDTVLAKAWCGESARVHAFSEMRQGDSLSILDEHFPQRFDLECGCAGAADEVKAILCPS